MFLSGILGAFLLILTGRAKRIEIQVNEKTDALKDSQLKLIQIAKMSALGEMSAGMAHEINNPLTIIKGYSNKIEQLAERKDNTIPELKEISQRISITTNRISKIIRGLRDFSRDGSSDPMIEAKVSSIIKDSLELCENRLKNNEVDITVGPIDKNLTIHCQPTQIAQVIINLLNNSFDALSEKQERWIRIDVLDQSDELEIVVTDSGTKIISVLHDKIMEPFFTTKASGQGTGLGLSISKGIIEKHKGELSLDPNSEKTRFICRLPKANKSNQTREV
jgi:C4-dicarboxylate-specific signal transduction histidine kinase